MRKDEMKLAQRIVDLEEDNKAKGKQIRDLMDQLEEKNKELDSMHFIWCDGGCETGHNRYGRTVELTKELLEKAERNVDRMVTWFYNSRHEAMMRVQTEEQFMNLLMNKWDDEYGTYRIQVMPDGERVLEIHTGGWKDNERVLPELENTFFWYTHWSKSERGGHYYLELPNMKKG